MNLENVNKAIAVMERVKARGDKVDMRDWQSVTPGVDAVVNEEDLHNCGTPACFAGWVAVSPEFQGDGGLVYSNGAPLFQIHKGPHAIREWLEISSPAAVDLCGCGQTSIVYGTPHDREVTVDGVLSALYRLRDTGSPYLEEDAQ